MRAFGLVLMLAGIAIVYYTVTSGDKGGGESASETGPRESRGAPVEGIPLNA